MKAGAPRSPCASPADRACLRFDSRSSHGGSGILLSERRTGGEADEGQHRDAQAGVIVPADPQAGLTYRQEYSAGQAEDAAEVLSLVEQAQVPLGHFRDVLLTKDFTPIEPRVLEYRLYAIGVGPVLVLGVSGGSDREELLRFRTPNA